MKRIACTAFLTFLISSFFISCGSTKMTNPQYLSYLDSENYAPCISYLEAKNKKANSDRIRDNFDLAMMKHYQKDYDSSLAILNETDLLMDDAVTKSVTKGFAAFLVNENAVEYAGNPYEYVYINIFNALNYYNKGDTEEAAVEIRRLNEKQRKFLIEYGEWLSNGAASENLEIPGAYKLLNLDTLAITQALPKNPTENDIFRDSATARYLSIVFGMMDDSVNNSWNISADARTLKALNSGFDVASETKISEGMGRLDILAFSGLIGRRGERRIRIGPFPGLQFPLEKGFVFIPPFDIEFAFPEFPAPQNELKPVLMGTIGWGPSFTLYPGKNEITKMPSNSVGKIQVVLDGEKKECALLEDFNYAVQQDVNTKARKAYNRSVGRSLTKKLAAVVGATAGMLAAEDALRKNESLLTIAAYAATYLGSAKAIDQVDKTETADIRQVYALPAQSYAAGFELAPGKYSFTVQYFSKNGTLIQEEHFKDIEVKKGKTVLVESSCQK